MSWLIDWAERLTARLERKTAAMRARSAEKCAAIRAKSAERVNRIGYQWTAEQLVRGCSVAQVVPIADDAGLEFYRGSLHAIYDFQRNAPTAQARARWPDHGAESE